MEQNNEQEVKVQEKKHSNDADSGLEMSPEYVLDICFCLFSDHFGQLACTFSDKNELTCVPYNRMSE